MKTTKRMVEEFKKRDTRYSMKPHYEYNGRKCNSRDLHRALNLWKYIKRKARIQRQFEALEDAELVRIRREPDEFMSYEDMAGDTFDPSNASTVPGGMRTIKAEEKEYKRKLEQDGAWGIIGEYRASATDKWIQGDSIWGMEYDYAFSEDNDCLLDVMELTIKSLRDTLANRCPHCHGTGKRSIK